ncbi:MAG: spermidine/putrescine ABC transporter substrate-binding protein [Sporichthyaceae bacterium]|nr:spermidine/putrescine ABC transporter substrate-binding protein [Sporichthyaceae bacterium]
MDRPGPARRDVLRAGAFGALGAVAAGPLLAACGSRDRPSSTPTGLDLSRPDHPVRLPLHDDIPMIADGLEPESGTLRILNYSEYNAPDVLKAFEKEYGVKVEVTTFVSIDEGVQKLNTPGAKFDVFYPTSDRIGTIAVGKLLQPLNKTYIPNLRNVWDQLQDPFYDQGSQYTVPHTLYTTGVLYRADRVDTVPANGYDLLWDVAHKGRIYLLDDDRETLGMAMLRKGITDVNTEDPAVIDAARADLEQLIDLVNIKIGATQYSTVPEGTATIHQAWAGDAVNAQYYLPEGVGPEVLGWWYPQDRRGAVGNDAFAVPTSADHPVLAHHFINYMLDNDNSIADFGYTGYQTPINALNPELMVTDEYVTENLVGAVIRPEDFDLGVQLLQLSPNGERLWDAAWAKFRAGA